MSPLDIQASIGLGLSGRKKELGQLDTATPSVQERASRSFERHALRLPILHPFSVDLPYVLVIACAAKFHNINDCSQHTRDVSRFQSGTLTNFASHNKANSITGVNSRFGGGVVHFSLPLMKYLPAFTGLTAF